MRERLEQALSELPLDKAEITSIAQRLLDSTLILRGNRPPAADSAFFDSRGKITALVDYFAADGLTLEDYVRAAVKQPSLFCQSPATIAANIEGVAEYFGGDGMTLKDYLRAAVKQPPLFTQLPSTVERNIEGVVELFRGEGLTLKDYLRAAVKQPPLFCLSPATIQSNIEGVVEHFRGEGLTLREYLHVAVKQPSLFYRSPATIRANIEAVIEHFRGEGLTLKDYLRAAVKQPQLFTQSPPTIIGHINMVAELYDQGLVRFREPADAPPAQPLQPTFKFLLANPQFLCLADENFALREVSARVSRNEFSGSQLLFKPRHAIEADLAARLGHADLGSPVPKEPNGDGNHHRHTRNLLLRALIRSNLIKGTLDR